MSRIKAWIKNTPRTELILYVSILGLLASLFLTPVAWSALRIYPLSPVIPNFSLPETIHISLFLAACIGLALSLYTSQYRRFLLSVSLVCLTILVLLDTTRLQPWVFHYSAILLLFSAFIPTKKQTSEHLLDAARIVIGGIYFWSGIQKMNLRFVSEIFPWFTQPIWEFIGTEWFLQACIGLGLVVPIIEAVLGVGFFIKKIRPYALLAAFSMLVLVMTSIGPLGHNWNSSVWPWNFAIFLSASILFWRTDFTCKEFIHRQRRNILGLLMFGLFWIMPAGNLVGLTDHYLSWSLYSGKAPEAILAGDQLFLESLSPEAAGGTLPFVIWTHSTMNIVPYPEVRVFTSVFTTLCSRHPEQDLSMQIRTSFGNNSFSRPREYSCK